MVCNGSVAFTDGFTLYRLQNPNPLCVLCNRCVRLSHLNGMDSVYSYLIIYDPATQPLEIVRILSGYRDVAALLK